MKILVKAYFAGNFGDDLLLHILFTRYPDAQFEILLSECICDYKKFVSRYENVKIIDNISVLHKIKNKLKIIYIDKSLYKGYDAVIRIGGSIFMENRQNNIYDVLLEKEVKYCNKKHIPYYIIGANFGPYTTIQYLKEKREIFHLCENVCFREKASYDLFSEMSNVMHTGDIAFAYKYNVPAMKENTLGISVVNIRGREKLSEYTQDYIKSIGDIVIEALMKEYKVTFFDFCRFENDSGIIKDIKDYVLSKSIDISDIEEVVYDDDVLEFAYECMSKEKIVCTRFHSMILGIISNREILPFIYSDKMKNVLSDIGQASGFIDIKDMKIPYKCKKYIISDKTVNYAQRTFEKLDELYEKRYKNNIDLFF